MKILGRWSVISFINFWVQLMWAGVAVMLCLLPLSFIFQFLGVSFVLIDLPINFSGAILSERLTIAGQESSVLFIDFVSTSYLPAIFQEGLNWPVSIITLAQMAGLGFILYGLSQLKKVLRNLWREKPFADENHSHLKVIAVMIMLISPLLYGYHWLSYWYFETYVDAQSLEAAYPNFDISYLIMGLIVLVIAEIFRQATEIHKEQKLTV